jgi:glycerol-3-phosphate dehydrogenase
VRLVKGSHIVLPRLYEGEHAFILQNDDRRVVFMIPYEERFTLLGTTDVDYEGDPASPRASEAEVDYLCRAAGRYLARAPAPAEVLWRYAGVRPLYDDGSEDPSAITRDYTLRVDDSDGAAPVLSVFGGKITTYRRLAEHALEKLATYFPGMKPAWTSQAPLPGSGFADRSAAKEVVFEKYRGVPPLVLQGVFRRHGTLATQVLGDGDVGEHYGAGLTERELRYLVEREWAHNPEDVLWRRTKCGLHMTEPERRRVAEVMGR